MKIKFPSWHEQITESKRFLEEFVDQTERQILLTISAYESDKDVNFDGDYFLEHYKGFDDGSYNVADLFKVYFPNLQRKSALITLYSYLEFELNELCENLRRNKNIKLSLRDLSDDGIKRASNFLIKVVNLEWDKSKGVWCEISNIQKLRNKIVHNNGKIDNENNKDASLREYIANSPHLFGEKDKEDLISEIIIKDGFLSYVLTKFYELFDEINETIS